MKLQFSILLTTFIITLSFNNYVNARPRPQQSARLTDHFKEYYDQNQQDESTLARDYENYDPKYKPAENKTQEESFMMKLLEGKKFRDGTITLIAIDTLIPVENNN